ncbi:MAG: PilZ domain-containing protein [Magnetococcales bacterium]|nr:PilZ domain-containing protein [Magnetococcales bacterium]
MPTEQDSPLLEQLLSRGRPLELRIAGTKAIHDAALLDFSILDEAGEPGYLLISALLPESGNRGMAPKVAVHLLLKDGDHCIEARTTVREEALVEARHAWRLELPLRFRKLPRRKLHRLKAASSFRLFMTAPFDAELIDLSRGGMAFRFDDGGGHLSKGEAVDLTLRVPDVSNEKARHGRPPAEDCSENAWRTFDVRGEVSYLLPKGNQGHKQAGRCGVTFLPDDADQAMAISEMVGEVERAMFTMQSEENRLNSMGDRLEEVGSVWRRLDP